MTTDIRKIAGSEMLNELGFRINPLEPVTDDNEFWRVEAHNRVIFYKLENFVVTDHSVFLITKTDIYGGGSMKVDSIFARYEDAVAHIIADMETSRLHTHVNHMPGINIYGAPYVVSGFQGYTITPMEVK